MTNQDMILGELREFKRAQLAHNEKMDTAIAELKTFKVVTMTRAKMTSIVISGGISVLGFLASLFVSLRH